MKNADCESMEVWLESGSKVPGVDRVVDEDLIIDGNAIYIEGKQVGRRRRQ